MREPELGGGLIQQKTFLLVAFLGLVSYADRRLPNLAGVARRTRGKVTLLGESERRRSAAVEAYGDQREARLLQISGEGACQLRLAGGGDRVQEIAHPRVLVTVTLQVG